MNLLPGLPEVKFSGLADMAIRESATRLKSAFQANGFKWPGRQQIVVNLSPASIKKNQRRDGFGSGPGPFVENRTNEISLFQ